MTTVATIENDLRELKFGERVGFEIRTPITKVLLAEVVVERTNFEYRAKVVSGGGRRLYNLGFTARGAKAMAVCLDAMVAMLAATLFADVPEDEVG